MSSRERVQRAGLGVVDWFVPAESKQDPDARRRCNLTVISALGLGYLAIPLLILNWQMVGHLGGTGVAFIASMTFLSLCALFLRLGMEQRWVGALITLDMLLALTAMTYFNGGVRSASLIWMIPIPLVGHLLVGRWFGLVCAVLGALKLAGFYVAHVKGISFPTELSQEETLLWHIVGGISSLLFVAGLGWYFEQERYRADQASRASDERLRMVVANADVLLLSLDAEGVIQLAVGKSVSGDGADATSLQSRSIFDVFPEEHEASFREALAGKTVTFESSVEGRDLQTSLAPVFTEAVQTSGVTCLSVDVTRRKQMEESVALSERMASLGLLAAGVGHEINNPLTYILGSIEFALEELQGSESAASEDLLESLRDAKEGAERVREIVSDLRLFARSEAEEEGSFHIGQVIERAITMASHEINHRARLVTEFAKTPRVMGIEGQLGQVILNLLVNAAQAIPPGSYEDNEISVRTAQRGESHVVIEIRDSGQGISPEVRSRLFEPFFTTKSATGTGLGLSISHRIVSSMGGTIEVESPREGGSLFRVVLPAVVGYKTPPIPDEAAGVSSAVKAAKILVVDDQVAVLRVLQRMLHEHDVIVASSGREALEKIGEQQFDLILCDLMMPDMTGIAVYESIRETRPELAERMAFMTGGVFTERAHEFLNERPERQLSKPFSPNDIRAFVERRLESLPV